MPFFSNFGSKKKSKSSLSLSGNSRNDRWTDEGNSNSLDRTNRKSDQRSLAKLEQINIGLEDRNLALEEENYMLKLKVLIIILNAYYFLFYSNRMRYCWTCWHKDQQNQIFRKQSWKG